MAKPIIGGIQQIGIGNPDTYKTWAWYRKAFHIDIPIFDEAATAALMLPYTGGQLHDRHAVLAMSMRGGGGIEIWQYTSRIPVAPKHQISIGDLGICIASVKSNDITKTYHHLKSLSCNVLCEPIKRPDGAEHFYVKDPYENMVDVVPSQDWFTKSKVNTGGIYGCTIGVSDMDQSLLFYKDILGYDTVIFDQTDVCEDFACLPGGSEMYRRVLLSHSQPRRGPFSEWIGSSEIELVQAIDRIPRKIFADRYWGDLGYIHLCYDVQGMAAMKSLCASRGYPFTVDSSDSFDMGEAAGHFSYIEDPDGTLIEFVEAHKIPILKKIGWYLDLRKRDAKKPLARWMLRALALNREKA